jgi:tRNA (guanine-N7-)-methyltransferase
MLLRKFFYTYILRKRILTVQLRGRVSAAGAKLLAKYRGSIVLSIRQAVQVIRKSQKPVLLEIGFGNGAHIVSLAKDSQASLIIGSEMYLDGVVRTLEKTIEQKIGNLHLVTKDARELLRKIPEKSLTECYVLFPDPWPKARHHKRRLVTEEFCRSALRRLARGGSLILATDWAEYAVEIETIVQKLIVSEVVEIGEVSPESRTRILSSTFAARAEKEGRVVYMRVIIRAK